MSEQFRFPEPPRENAELHSIWLLWYCLAYLNEQAKKGDRKFVKSSELRRLIGERVDQNSNRVDEILETLRRSKAIGRLNSGGKLNRQYYITRVGLEIMKAYEMGLGGQ